MIIWKGLGFLGALIPFVLILLMNSFLGSASIGWAFLTSAVPVWLLGRSFHARPAEMKIDPKTQQNILVKQEHDLFWVELDYWAIIFAIMGIAILLPDSIKGIANPIAQGLVSIIIFGRIGFSLYQKYLKKDNGKAAITLNQSLASNTAAPNKEEKLSRFTKKKTERSFGISQSKEITTDNNKGLPASEMKKKAFYAQMRKDREAPKKFKTSTHSNYFPGSARMPFIPKNAILNKETATEEE